MYNQKGQALLIVLLIAAATFGYLIYSGKINLPQKQIAQTLKSDASPVPNGTGETANWKTYTNTKYNFTFLYQDTTDLSARDYVNDEGFIVDLTDKI